MDLRCKLGHLFGTQVIVSGSTYPISADGIVRSVKDEDAKKLLQNDEGWAELVVRTPAKATPPLAPLAAIPDSSPDPVEVEPSPTGEPEPTIDIDASSRRRTPPRR